MTDTDDIFDELSKDFDNKFKKENKKLPAEIADINVTVPLYEDYEQISDEDIDEALEENEPDPEVPKGTYTMADMRAWYKILNDGQPYHTILTFGHGKNRIWGEGQFGAYPAGIAHASERAFIKLLGEELYKTYLEKLMGVTHEVKQNEETIQVPKVSLQMTHKPPILKLPKKIFNTVEPSTIQNNIPLPEPIKEQPKKNPTKEEEKERLRA